MPGKGESTGDISTAVLVIGSGPVSVDPGMTSIIHQLESAGVDVDIWDAGQRPNFLPQKRYGAIVMDLDGLGGVPSSFVAEVRRRFPREPLVATGRDPKPETLVELIKAHTLTYLSKPPNRRDLEQALRLVRDTSSVETERPPSGGVFRANRELLQLNETLRKHVSQLTILYQMGRDISENENWSDALDRFLMALVSYAAADGSALLLFSDEERRLAVRSNFHIDPAILSQSCQVLLENWSKNPRGGELHPVESYREGVFDSCLERSTRWRFTIVPLRYRSRSFGFLLVEKSYRSGRAFQVDYNFFNTIQTILAEEVANACYISELRQLGRFNQKVLDTINSGVVTTDLDGSIRFFNALASRMCPWLGWGQRVHFDQLFRSDAFGSDFYERLIASKKDTYILEARYVGGGEQLFPARLSTTKMHDDNLNGTVIVAIFEDLTERKLLEKEIRRNDRLRVLGQLSASVAHEIRNPLTGIATSAEVLRDRLEPKTDEVRYIRVILEEIARLDDIIRSLMNFARPAKPQIDSCNLLALSDRVVALLGDEARKRMISLEVRNELEHEWCRADLDQLTQVLLNLVLNAIQACSERDSVRVELRNEVGSKRPAVKYARIDVVDTGPGVPEKIRDTLFEPFVTTKTHGTGLGLAISQQIVEEHNGRIECEFLEGETRFIVRLPIESAAVASGESTT